MEKTQLVDLSRENAVDVFRLRPEKPFDISHSMYRSFEISSINNSNHKHKINVIVWEDAKDGYSRNGKDKYEELYFDTIEDAIFFLRSEFKTEFIANNNIRNKVKSFFKLRNR